MKNISKKVTLLLSALILLGFFLECSAEISKNKANGKLNINTATQKELTLLPGIGVNKAKRIIELRKQIKGFKYLDDLLKVKGMGKKLYSKILPFIKLEGQSDLVISE